MTKANMNEIKTAQYRKKPVVIEAVQWDGTEAGCWRIKAAFPQLETLAKSGHLTKPEVTHWKIGTLEGGHVVTPGDWIIQGVKGELYPCKPDIFAATYEQVTDSADSAQDVSVDTADAKASEREETLGELMAASGLLVFVGEADLAHMMAVARFAKLVRDKTMKVHASLASNLQAGEPKRKFELTPEMREALAKAQETRSTVAEMPNGGIMFINYGDQPEDTSALECPYCGGSGHKDDVVDRPEPIGFVSTGDDDLYYFVPYDDLRRASFDGMQLYAATPSQQAGKDAQDAARYRALRNGGAICAPGIKPIGRIAVGFPHYEMSEADKQELDAAIDCMMQASPAQAENGEQK